MNRLLPQTRLGTGPVLHQLLSLTHSRARAHTHTHTHQGRGESSISFRQVVKQYLGKIKGMSLVDKNGELLSARVGGVRAELRCYERARLSRIELEPQGALGRLAAAAGCLARGPMVDPPAAWLRPTRRTALVDFDAYPAAGEAAAAAAGPGSGAARAMAASGEVARKEGGGASRRSPIPKLVDLLAELVNAPELDENARLKVRPPLPLNPKL